MLDTFTSSKSFRTPDWCASDSCHLQTRVEKGLTQDWVKGRLSVGFLVKKQRDLLRNVQVGLEECIFKSSAMLDQCVHSRCLVE